MQKELILEVKALKDAIVRLIGVSNLSEEDQFSKEALDKAAQQFQKLSIERGDWIEDRQIKKVIKSANYRSGLFIIKELGFTNYFKRGRIFYFNKKALIALGKELKARDINLVRYMEYIEDQTKFRKYISMAVINNSPKKGKHPFKIPSDIYNITTSQIKMPSADIIREDINRLMVQFSNDMLSDYIDIYKDNYAMLKSMYYFEKYLEPGLKKKCKKWCENFNYANYALEEVTKA